MRPLGAFVPSSKETVIEQIAEALGEEILFPDRDMALRMKEQIQREDAALGERFYEKMYNKMQIRTKEGHSIINTGYSDKTSCEVWFPHMEDPDGWQTFDDIVSTILRHRGRPPHGAVIPTGEGMNLIWGDLVRLSVIDVAERVKECLE